MPPLRALLSILLSSRMMLLLPSTVMRGDGCYAFVVPAGPGVTCTGRGRGGRGDTDALLALPDFGDYPTGMGMGGLAGYATRPLPWQRVEARVAATHRVRRERRGLTLLRLRDNKDLFSAAAAAEYDGAGAPTSTSSRGGVPTMPRMNNDPNDTGATTATTNDGDGVARLLLLSRRIERCGKDWRAALSLLRSGEANDDDGPVAAADADDRPLSPHVVAAMKCLYTSRRWREASDLYRDHFPTSEHCRSLAISVCGQCKRWREALGLLNHDGFDNRTETSPAPAASLSSYHAAIAACGRGGAWEEALKLFYVLVANNNSTETVTAGNNIPAPTTMTYKTTLSALARCRRGREAAAVLRSMGTGCNGDDNDGRRDGKKMGGDIGIVEPDATCYLHAMTACVRSGYVDLAEELFRGMGRDERLLRRRRRDDNSAFYDLLVSAYGRVDRWGDVSRLEGERRRRLTAASPPARGRGVTAGEGTGGCAKDGEGEVEREDDSPDEDGGGGGGHRSHYFRHWDDGMERVGRGKDSWWVLGHQHYFPDDGGGSMEGNSDAVVNLTVGLRPHRNPSKNGMQLCFFREKDAGARGLGNGEERRLGAAAVADAFEKVGFLLMKNGERQHQRDVGRKPMASRTDRDGSGGGANEIRSGVADDENRNDAQAAEAGAMSTLLGMKVAESHRGMGLSKVFVAVWIALCLRAGVSPRTGVINKPLLALVLQRRFHFVPQSDAGGGGGGVPVEIVPTAWGNTTVLSPTRADANWHDRDPPVLLRSPPGKSLVGAISPWDLQRQNIVISREAHPVEATGGTEGELNGARHKIHLGANLSAPKNVTLLRKIAESVIAGEESGISGCFLYCDEYITAQKLRAIMLGT